MSTKSWVASSVLRFWRCSWRMDSRKASARFAVSAISRSALESKRVTGRRTGTKSARKMYPTHFSILWNICWNSRASSWSARSLPKNLHKHRAITESATPILIIRHIWFKTNGHRWEEVTACGQLCARSRSLSWPKPLNLG